jgi:hypothetical protein
MKGQDDTVLMGHGPRAFVWDGLGSIRPLALVVGHHLPLDTVVHPLRHVVALVHRGLLLPEPRDEHGVV